MTQLQPPQEIHPETTWHLIETTECLVRLFFRLFIEDLLGFFFLHCIYYI